MEGFIAFVVLPTVALVIVCVICAACQSAARRKKKEEKLIMLDRFPHLAGQILQSIDDDDARYEDRMARAVDGLSQAGQKVGNSLQGMSMPAPRKSKAAGTVKTAVKVARWLAK